jgi:hypothetical protein
MQCPVSIFTLFGGVRPMARELGVPKSNVSAWKTADRIPAGEQPHVLEVGLALGLPITAELVIFPSGDVPDAVARAAPQDCPCTPAAAVPNAAAVFHGVDRTGGTQYGKRSAGLHACDRTVRA